MVKSSWFLLLCDISTIICINAGKHNDLNLTQLRAKGTDVTKTDMKMGKKHWMPRVMGWVCPSPKIYGSPTGVALWPCAAPHIIIISGRAVRRDGETGPRCEKWS